MFEILERVLKNSLPLGEKIEIESVAGNKYVYI